MIGLTMIVRDEAEMLPKTMPSVAEIVERVCIVDTGSTDDTRAVARRFWGDTNAAHIELPWEGFADTRSKALLSAEEIFPDVDYWLCLDADMKLEVDKPLPELDRDAYFLTLPGPFRMSLPLLLKAHKGWRWEGAAHSYLVWPANCSTAELPNIRIFEQRANSPRVKKFEDDLAALEGELDPRTVFYFAQTLRDLGHSKEAADAYRFRIRLSSDSPQDVFWACYQEGLLRLETEGLAAATPVLLEAFSRRPTRAESLWLLAHQYRLAGQPEVALMFALRGEELAMPDDRGFVLAWVYEWGMLNECALAYRALGMDDMALECFESIVKSRRDTSEEAQTFIYQQIEELTAKLERPTAVAGSPA